MIALLMPSQLPTYINANNILYFEGDARQTKIVLSGGEAIDVNNSPTALVTAISALTGPPYILTLTRTNGQTVYVNASNIVRFHQRANAWTTLEMSQGLDIEVMQSAASIDALT